MLLRFSSKLAGIRWQMWVAAIAACFLLAGAGGAAAALQFEANRRDLVLKGVKVGGVRLDGMEFAAARARLLTRFKDPLSRPIDIQVDGQRFETTPRELGVSTNVENVYRKAVSLHSGMPLPVRAWHRLTGIPVDRHFKVATSIDENKAKPFIDQISKKVDRPPVDAAVSLNGAGISISQEKTGYSLDKKAAEEKLKAAALSQASSITLTGKVLPAAVPKSKITNVLVLKVGENKLFHYRGEQMVKAYDVATGTGEFPTPKGNFKIVNKRARPTWVNPAKSPGEWGAKLPARIPPGPGNPLGTRAMDLNSPGIRIHGTYADSSIGFNASHGCIRMRIADVEELFELVPVGTPVLIVQAGPNRPPASRGGSTGPEPLAESDGTSVPGLGRGGLAAAPPPPPQVSPPADPDSLNSIPGLDFD